MQTQAIKTLASKLRNKLAVLEKMEALLEANPDLAVDLGLSELNESSPPETKLKHLPQKRAVKIVSPRPAAGRLQSTISDGSSHLERIRGYFQQTGNKWATKIPIAKATGIPDGSVSRMLYSTKKELFEGRSRADGIRGKEFRMRPSALTPQINESTEVKAT